MGAVGTGARMGLSEREETAKISMGGEEEEVTMEEAAEETMEEAAVRLWCKLVC